MSISSDLLYCILSTDRNFNNQNRFAVDRFLLIRQNYFNTGFLCAIYYFHSEAIVLTQMCIFSRLCENVGQLVTQHEFTGTWLMPLSLRSSALFDLQPTIDVFSVQCTGIVFVCLSLLCRSNFGGWILVLLRERARLWLLQQSRIVLTGLWHRVFC